MKRARCVRVTSPRSKTRRTSSSISASAGRDGAGLRRAGDAAIQFWSEGLGELPDDWDLFVPEDLVDTQVRQSLAAFPRLERDGLAQRQGLLESEGVGVDRDELGRCLAEGKNYVRLSDGSFAPFDAARCRR